MTNEIKRFLLLMEECKIKLPILAEELNASGHKVSWKIEEEDDVIEHNGTISLTFGKYGSYHAGSYVNLKHGFEAAANTIREYHAEWLKEENKRNEERQVKALKEQLYNDYINGQLAK